MRFYITEEEKKHIMSQHINLGYNTFDYLREEKEEMREWSSFLKQIRNLKGGVKNLAPELRSVMDTVEKTLQFGKSEGKPIMITKKGKLVAAENANEIVRAINAGRIAEDQLAYLTQGMLKNKGATLPNSFIDDLAPKVVDSDSFMQRYTNLKYNANTRGAWKDALKAELKAAGYTDEAIEGLVKSAENNKKFRDKLKRNTTKSRKSEQTKVDDNTPLSKRKWFQYAKNAAIVGGVAFTLYYLYNYWKKSSSFPECIKNMIPDPDDPSFQNYVDNGYILFQNQYRVFEDGNYIFVDSGNMRELGKGTWKYYSDNNIIEFTSESGGVKQFTCELSPVPPPPPNPQLLCPTYRYTRGPEFKVCSYNPSEDLIKKVQGCLAKRNNSILKSDGYFGAKTQAALNVLFPDKKFNDMFTTNDIPEICGESRLGPEYQQDDMMDPDQIEAAKRAGQQANQTGGTGNQQNPDGPDIYRDATANPQSSNPQTNKQKPIMNKGFNMSGVERPYNEYLNQ